MKYKSFAKLNLMLNVVGRTDDGYHDLEMIMVPIDLFDTVDLEVSSKMKMKSNKRYIPNDKRNTVIKTIELLRDRYHFTENFKIRLMKNTPTRGGMGGGSSNAASVIKMVDEMLDLNMSFDEMFDVAKDVGSDVPFTLYGKPAIAKGVGEQLHPLTINMDFHIFIVKPKKGVSTPQLFKRLDINNLKHYDVNVVQEALEEGNYDRFIKTIGNSLEDAAMEIVPEIKRVKKELIDFGFDVAMMSGAGSSVFAITQNEQLVRDAVVHFYDKYDFVKKSRIIGNVLNVEKIG